MTPFGCRRQIVEKWRAWADSGGDLQSAFSRDFLLTNIVIYWITETIPTSIRDYLLQKLPFRVDLIQTDNGGEFGSQFHVHVLDRGIRHVYIKPATPRLNGKVERSHRIDEEEFYRMLDGLVIDDTKLFNDKLQEWENFYNFNRPHGGLDGQTPYERLKAKTTETPPV